MLRKREAATLASGAFIATLIVAAVVILFPHLSGDLSKKQVSVAAFKALEPGENIVYYRKQKEYAPVFYARGRVLFYRQVNDVNKKPIPGKSTLLPPGTLSTGDEVDALTPSELKLAIDASPTRSVVIITKREGAVELASSARFYTQLIGQQGKVMALRVSLLPGAAR